MENLKEALQYIVGLGNEAEKTEVLQIHGRTYANRNLTRYDKPDSAEAIVSTSLTAMVDYIKECHDEFTGDMILHVVSPTKVRFMSVLDKERNREVLFQSEAVVSGFRFDEWYDQERFMIGLQANFMANDDLAAVMKLAGNIERKNEQAFSDDGMTQVATMTVGVAAKADVIVPNPVELIPYRTFQEVEQPASKFVFRIGEKGDPSFKIVEAQGGIWKNEAVANIKAYLKEQLKDTETGHRVTVIG